MGESAKQDDDGDDDVTDHVRVAWGHFIAAPALLVFVLVAPYVHKSLLTLLLASSVVACLPLVLDALLVPLPRRGAAVQAGLSVPGTGYIVAGTLAAMCAYGVATNDVGAAREFGVTLAGLICAAIAMVGVVWCFRATAQRRKLVATAVRARPHRHPPQDGESGALDGKLSGGTHKVGHEEALVSIGTNTTAWGSSENRCVSESPFSNVATNLAVVSERGARVDVGFGDAAWLTLIHLSQSTGSTSVGDHGVTADIIGPDHPVRVVGRVRDGRFVDEGPGSIIIVAAVRNVRHSIRVLHMRDQASLALALLGMACFIGAIVVFVRA